MWYADEGGSPLTLVTVMQARAAEESERGVTGSLAKAAAAQAEDAFKSAAAATGLCC